MKLKKICRKTPLYCHLCTVRFPFLVCIFVLLNQLATTNKTAMEKQAINITVETTVHALVEKVWQYWTLPEHIMQWNNASPDWHTPHAENDLRAGGKFTSRMEARDGSIGFDFWGIYDEVILHERIAYTMGDGRKAGIRFSSVGNETTIAETFEAETENSVELQKTGWQAILDNFRQYVESN
jgi:uncharacterized protein YndB with AHSA1/START domain